MPRLAYALATCLALAACGDAPTDNTHVEGAEAASPSVPVGVLTVHDVVAASPDLSAFARLVEQAGLTATLSDTARAVTVFAPNNAALAEANLAGLPADSLRTLLLGHVLDTRLFSTDALGEMTVETASGSELTLDSGDETLTVSSGGTTARVVAPDLDAENGVVHGIDTVLSTP